MEATNNELATEATELPSLLQLNDDCLHQIFNYLNVKEQLALTETCQRICWIITQMIWKSHFHEVRTVSKDTDVLSNEQYQQLFHHIVPHMRKFTIADNQHLAFSSYLGRYTWRPELDFYLSFQFPRLVSLACHDRRIHDGLLRLVAENCPQLQELRVSSNYITGAHIKDMHQLRALHLPKCSLQTTHLRALLQHLQLTHLDITDTAAEVAALADAGGASSSLQHLWLSENSMDAAFVASFGQLSHMRCLVVRELYEEPVLNINWKRFFGEVGSRIVKLSVFNASDASTLRAFAACAPQLSSLERLFIKADMPDRCLQLFCGRLPHLRELQLYCYREFTPAAIVQFIASSHGLRGVDLVCCESLFDLSQWMRHWIFDLITVLRHSGRQRVTLNIALMCFNGFLDKITCPILQDERYTSQHTLRVTFNVPPISYEPTLDRFLEIHFK